ncbi:hypothetical protein AB0B45_35620 [Nonomuraea sp. NPDC049152]|uniref:hypothetical protein n=1 Tax=Nonomuraea sp. NPDC049152 TaxID=3154350 RepID=UPI0033EC9FAD
MFLSDRRPRSPPGVPAPSTSARTPAAPELLAADVEDVMARAAIVRAALLQRSLAHATHLIRHSLPEAAAMAADVGEVIPSADDGSRVALLAVHDGEDTIWHTMDADHDEVLPPTELDEIEAILTDALRFGFTHQMLDKLGWKDLYGKPFHPLPAARGWGLSVSRHWCARGRAPLRRPARCRR